MFYLETKDGEKFCTDVKSNDREEFEKIIEQKLGADAVEIFNQILAEVRSEEHKTLAEDIDYIIGQLYDIKSDLE